MNRRTYMWKAGGLAVVMVAVVIWLLGCSRESIEDVMEEGALSAPEISIAVSSLDSLPTLITVPVNGSSYEIELVSPMPVAPSDTWCYYVRELAGSQSLSHWVFAVDCLVEPVNHIVGTSPPATTIGYDGSTGYTGVKWDLPEDFTEGMFCITLDGIYPPALVDVVVKTGSGFGVGSIAGPDCEIIQHNDLLQGTGE
jgi:hypothetical protein